MICKKCNNSIPDTSKFCPKCGAKIEIATARDIQTKKCPSCGAENPASARFCKADGYNFQQAEKKPEGKPTEVEKPSNVLSCPKCGTSYPLTAKFCKKDGAPLKEDIKSSLVREIKPEVLTKPTIKESVPLKAESRKKAIGKTSRIWAWITISGVVLIILSGGSYLYFSGLIGKKPENLQRKINTELEEKKLGSISVQINKEWGATLSGVISKPFYRRDASDIVKSHKEVKEIIDNIQTTADMEKKINNALKGEGINEIYANLDDDLIITLKGFASDEYEKGKAVTIAKGFKELKDLKDEIQIKTPSEIVKGNTARIEEELNQIFTKRGLKNIRAQVGEDLVATLSGTAKSSDDKTLAITIAKSYRELRGVTDEIRVEPLRLKPKEEPMPAEAPAPAEPPTPSTVDVARLQEEINMALKRSGLSNVYAEVDRDLVATLNGFVNDKAEESDAINITKSYRQLGDVRSRIQIKLPTMQPKELEVEIRKALISAGIGKVAVNVSENFVVTLKGVVITKVQKDEALRITRSFKGVNGMRDFIFVLTPW